MIFRCHFNECDAKFLTSNDLKDHLLYDHGDLNFLKRCLICNQEFSTRKELITHEKSNHAGMFYFILIIYFNYNMK